jgi:hypothetical protein
MVRTQTTFGTGYSRISVIKYAEKTSILSSYIFDGMAYAGLQPEFPFEKG